jgi:hypothetical protein
VPAFTAIATAVVSYAFYGTVAVTAFTAGSIGAFVVSVVATALAAGTARLINGSGGSGGTRQDNGTRIQFAPGTSNKIPVIYGSVWQRGIITDARLSNENRTMTYVLVLSEKTQTGTFSIGDIYWNDQKLIFNTGAGSEHIVASSIDGANNTDTQLADLVRVRVYSGSVAAADQIFPPQSSGNTELARTTLGESDSNYQLNGLVFAVVQIDYNSEKGTTGLPQLVFQVNNTLKNPGDVWQDYMTSSRYGANYGVDQINTTTSIGSTSTSLKSISNQIPANQFEGDGVTTSTQVRYEINGILSTADPVKVNVDKINFASASWTTFDYNDGKWRVIPNRAATTAELNSAFVFNDDNILGDISITATSLEDLYNSIEVEYPSKKIRDQNDYYLAEIDPAERNDLEPDNTMNLRLELVNNALHAARLGLIELKGSRVDKIITLRADYSAIQCQTGDVVKVTTAAYGFDNKLFRIMKIREVEDEGGMLTVEITALEYLANIYTDETLIDNADVAGSGIPIFGGSASLPPPSAPIVINTATTASVPNFTLQTTIDPTSGPVNEIQWFYSSTSSTGFAYLTNEFSAGGNFAAGSTVTDVITLVGGTYYFRARSGLNQRYSDLSSTSTVFVWTPGV